MTGGGASRGRVLVVDDEMHLRLYIQAVFDSAGYETATARDGEEGLKKARDFKPDLVSLDLMMPGQGGIRFMQGLWADEELKTTPVLVISAVDDATFRHGMALVRAGAAAQGAAVPAGPDGYVEKPPQPQVILAAAEKILGAASAPQSSIEGGEHGQEDHGC